MAKGDHIFVTSRILGIPYQHHGIDMGDGTVIHLAGRDGARIALRDASDRFIVRRDSISDFCKMKPIQIFVHEQSFSPDQIATRAEELLHKPGYSLLDGNCEHFATYCATGVSASRQVEIGQSTLACATSLATKAAWAVAARQAIRASTRTVLKAHPLMLLADGVEAATLAVGCSRGLSPDKCRQIARTSGNVAALSIGTFLGGPMGAALALAAHNASTATADSLCNSVRKLLR